MAHMSAAGEVLVRCCVFSAQSDYIRINQGQGLMSIPASQPRHLSPEQPSPALSGHRPQIQGPARGASSVKKSSNLRRFTVPGEGPYPTRAFSWLKAATTAFTFKTLLRHYAKRALTPQSLNMKLGLWRKGH